MALAVLLTSLTIQTANANTTPAAIKGCTTIYKSSVAYKKIKKLIHHTRPTVKKGLVQRYAKCLATRAKSRHAHEVARKYWKWRHSAPQIYRILLLKHYTGVLGWLASTKSCESGGNYRAISNGGTYRGAYQFSFSTWRTVGGSGDPAAAHPWEQDYRAAKLVTTGGTGHWPVCG